MSRLSHVAYAAEDLLKPGEKLLVEEAVSQFVAHHRDL